MTDRDELMERTLRDPSIRKRMAEIDKEIEQRRSHEQQAGVDTLGHLESKQADPESGVARRMASG